jgi:hypothetical protein
MKLTQSLVLGLLLPAAAQCLSNADARQLLRPEPGVDEPTLPLLPMARESATRFNPEPQGAGSGDGFNPEPHHWGSLGQVRSGTEIVDGQRIAGVRSRRAPRALSYAAQVELMRTQARIDKQIRTDREEDALRAAWIKKGGDATDPLPLPDDRVRTLVDGDDGMGEKQAAPLDGHMPAPYAPPAPAHRRPPSLYAEGPGEQNQRPAYIEKLAGGAGADVAPPGGE